MNVAIIGTGYVGLVTGASLALLGNTVKCHDIDQEKVNLLLKGRVPFFEPYLESIVQDQVTQKRLIFSSNLSTCISDADFIFITVGTPTDQVSGAVNLEYVCKAATSIGKLLTPDKSPVIINKSTVPVGSHKIVQKMIEEGVYQSGNDNVHFAVASNPEFLREGSAIIDFFYPDRIVIGSENTEALARLELLYRPLLDQSFNPPTTIPPRPEGFSQVPLIKVDPISSELIKYASNAFLAMKISFINEIANISDRLGGNIHDISRGIGLDRRIGPHFLKSGLGWGGSCFGKDLKGLVFDASASGYNPKVLTAVLESNSLQRTVPILKLQSYLKSLRGKSIGVLGLSFKPDTDDLRDAPSIEIIKKLVDLHAIVKVYDPVAMNHFRANYPSLPIKYANDEYDLVNSLDGLILVTEWDQFTQLDWKKIYDKMKHKVVVDGRNVLDKNCLEAIGFVYYGIGS
ncbi:nucleotide sugar dehydrogenase [Heliobacillus mobilis]